MKHRFVKFLKRFIYAFLLVLGSIPIVGYVAALFYSALTEAAWNDHLDDLRSRGETVEIQDVEPIPIEDDGDNFAKHPTIHAIITLTRENPDDEDLYKNLEERNIPGYLEAKLPKIVRLIQHHPLNAKFPTLSEEEAASNILEYCNDLDELEGFSEAARRPKSNFDISYEEGYSLNLAELNHLVRIIGFCNLQANAALTLENYDDAASHIETLLRAANHLTHEPSLLFQLVRAVCYERGISMVVKGLKENRWDMNALSEFQPLLTSEHLDFRFVEALRMERAAFTQQMMELRRGNTLYHWNGTSNEKYGRIKLPRSLSVENALRYSQSLESKIGHSPSLPLSNNTSTGSLLNSSDFANQPINRFRFHLAITAMSPLDAVFTRLTRLKVILDQASFAIDLEKHRNSYGVYPIENDILQTPIDPYTGDPIPYLSDGDTYLLYSIGSNREDDGGLLKYDVDHGDWVWSLRLPEDFDQISYLGTEEE